VFTPPGNGDKETGKIEMVDGVPMLHYEDTNAAGAYDAAIGTGGDTVHVRFAAQPDTAESDLTEITPSQIDTLSQSSLVVNYPDPALEQTLSKARIGTELWLPLALAAVFCAVGETYLADWFSRSR